MQRGECCHPDFKPLHVYQMMFSRGGNDYLSIKGKVIRSTLFEAASSYSCLDI
jgi:hypothetical protein